MSVNKVVMNTENGAETLIDLTGDTVTPETLAEGVTAHDASGERILGKMPIYKNLTLGVHTDGLLYVFSDGQPIGNGIEMPDKIGDVYGNIDSGNNIILKGYMSDGTYSVKYEMDDGEIINIGNMVLDTNVYYSVTKNLTYCTISNSATEVIKGNSYSATITTNSGYVLKSVSVTMGGNPVTVSGGTISIANVTGNIVITAVAEVSKPTNLLPDATFTDSEISSFSATQQQESANGYVSGYRLSTSKGTLSVLNGACTSGFIPVGINDIVTIENITLDQSSGNVNNVLLYNSNKERVYGLGGPSGGKVFGDGVTSNNGIHTFTPSTFVSAGTSVGFFRISCASITTNSIITVTKA